MRNGSLWNELYHKELWHKGILSEVEWWEHWLATDEGLKWKNDSQDPQRLLQDYLIKNHIHHIPYDSISILDVGAGPITSLGYTYPGKVVHITSIDPLANEYKRILKKANIISPVQTVFCHGEHLLDKFKPESFDFAYACNSLDHSYDPLLIVQNMLSVVKRDRFVILRHYVNEGKNCNYDGLHQWNFEVRGNDLIIWNEAFEHNVARMLHREAHVECYYESSLTYGGFDYNDWVVCIIKKLKAG